MSIGDLYRRRLDGANVQYPDIHEHLPTLRAYAEEVGHIVEIGTRTGNSTTGFLMGLSKNGGEMHSYDIDKQNFTPPEIPNVSWFFHQQNTHAEDCQIPKTDLLFIDGDHAYESVMKDLRFAPQARKFIIMHDTSQEWAKDNQPGVINARNDFLHRNPNWKIREHFENCNGLSILERHVPSA